MTRALLVLGVGLIGTAVLVVLLLWTVFERL